MQKFTFLVMIDATVASTQMPAVQKSKSDAEKIAPLCFGETLIVFLEHAGKALELINSSVIGLRDVRGEAHLLFGE
jgi:hypothetical protein